MSDDNLTDQSEVTFVKVKVTGGGGICIQKRMMLMGVKRVKRIGPTFFFE